ncbi:MAG: dihydropteroate synthase [Candidatus Saccharibacteria bacterium]|nr:dihydropteroate synthase [Candidatus Saccharibacteria bacterium]
MVKLVGILNVTPDSFTDGGNFFDPAAALAQAKKLFTDGAAMVDVGAESTRPHAVALTPDEEWLRLEPVLRELLVLYSGKISVDTYHPETVHRALSLGPVIINDVTGMNNPGMVEAVSELKPTVIISHLPGADIQAAHASDPVSTVEQVKRDLLAKAELLMSKGLSREQIILDPGVGFGKTMALNEKLLKFAEEVPEYKVMIGYSRKRFLGEKRLDNEVNLAAGRIAKEHGAAYIRVHDVAGHASLL